MLYTEKTKRAIKLAYDAHAGQTDKSGLPYIHHPLHLAEQMQDEPTTVLALLHDVVEDTPYSIEDIAAMGFGQEITEALKLMTHDKSVPYMDYVEKLKWNPLARTVKLADLRHNSDLTRLNEVTEKDLKRIEKYKTAIGLLESERD